MTRLLVVDDEPSARTLMKMFLEAQGFEVATAENGAQAWALTRLECPDLVIADVVMPEMDGYALTEAIRSSPDTAGIPVILISAHHDALAMRTGFEAGADDFIAKPLEMEVLQQRVEALVHPGRAEGATGEGHAGVAGARLEEQVIRHACEIARLAGEMSVAPAAAEGLEARLRDATEARTLAERLHAIREEQVAVLSRQAEEAARRAEAADAEAARGRSEIGRLSQELPAARTVIGELAAQLAEEAEARSAAAARVEVLDLRLQDAESALAEERRCRANDSQAHRDEVDRLQAEAAERLDKARIRTDQLEMDSLARVAELERRRQETERLAEEVHAHRTALEAQGAQLGGRLERERVEHRQALAAAEAALVDERRRRDDEAQTHREELDRLWAEVAQQIDEARARAEHAETRTLALHDEVEAGRMEAERLAGELRDAQRAFEAQDARLREAEAARCEAEIRHDALANSRASALERERILGLELARAETALDAERQIRTDEEEAHRGEVERFQAGAAEVERLSQELQAAQAATGQLAARLADEVEERLLAAARIAELGRLLSDAVDAHATERRARIREAEEFAGLRRIHTDLEREHAGLRDLLERERADHVQVVDDAGAALAAARRSHEEAAAHWQEVERLQAGTAEQVAVFRRDADDATAAARALEAALSSSRAEVETLAGELRVAQETVEQLAAQRAEEAEARSAAAARAAELDAQLVDVHAALAGEREASSAVSGELAELMRRHAELETSNIELRQLLERERADHMQAVDDAGAALAAARRSHEEAAAHWQEVERLQAGTVEQVAVLRRDADNAAAAARALEAALSGSRAEVETLAGELRVAQESVEQLAAQRAEEAEARSAAAARAAELDAQLVDVHAALAGEREASSTVSGELAELMRRHAELETSNIELRQLLEREAAEHHRLQDEAEVALSDERRRHAEADSALRDDIDRLQATAAEHLAVMRREADEAAGHAEAVATELSRSRAEVDRLEDQLRRVEAEMQRRVAEALDHVDMAQGRALALERELAEQRSEHERLARQLVEIRASEEVMAMRLQEEAASNAAAESRCRELGLELEDTRADVLQRNGSSPPGRFWRAGRRTPAPRPAPAVSPRPPVEPPLDVDRDLDAVILERLFRE